MRNLIILILLVLCGLAQAQTVPHTFYLAPREDGLSGNGTYLNPYNCSTPERMAKVWKNLMAVNTGYRKITFLPGVYYVSNMLNIPSGMHNVTLMGYGATLIAQLPDQAANWGFFGPPNNDNLVIEGFDMDCGSQVTPRPGSTFWRTGAISGGGKSIAYRNLIIRNLLCRSGQESFGILCNPITRGAVIADNLVLPVINDGGVSCIVSMGANNVVVGNNVWMGDPVPYSTYSFAFTLYSVETVLLGNATRELDNAVSMDFAGNMGGSNWRDNIIVGNSFVVNERPVRIDASDQWYTDWTFVGNLIKSDREWLFMCNFSGAAKVTGFLFVGNRFSPSAVMTGTRGPISFVTYDHHVFFGNAFGRRPLLNGQYDLFPKLSGMGNVVMGVPDDSWFGVK